MKALGNLSISNPINRVMGFTEWSQIAVLGAALSYAYAAIFGRRFKGLSPLVVATGMLCGSAVMMTPVAFLVDRPWHIEPDGTALMALVGLAAISTSVAYLIYFKVLASAGPTNLLLVTFLIPLSAILLGAMVLGERLQWNAFAGMGLIFIGLLSIDGRVIEKLRCRKNNPANPTPHLDGRHERKGSSNPGAHQHS